MGFKKPLAAIFSLFFFAVLSLTVLSCQKAEEPKPAETPKAEGPAPASAQPPAPAPAPAPAPVPAPKAKPKPRPAPAPAPAQAQAPVPVPTPAPTPAPLAPVPAVPAAGDDLFPSFGSGPVEVRLYTDYYCGPCRALEPEAEPLLKEMVKKNRIRLLLVDVPMHQHTVLYARHFLYALKAKSELEQAFLIRNALIEASRNEGNITKEKLEGVLKEKKIPYEVFDMKTVFYRYDALIREDSINATPTIVIIKGGQKKKYTGRDEILAAIKAL